MGDMADFLIDKMESGESLCQDKKTKEYKIVDNVELMYATHNYRILRECYFDCNDCEYKKICENLI